MEVVLCFAGVIHLAKKLTRKFHEVKINASVFELEITISCNNLVQTANSLNTANKNLGTLCSEHIESSICKHMKKQLPLLEEGRQGIWDMLKWLSRQAQSFKGSWGFVVMWKWKNLKPFFDWLGAQMQFMLLNILVINSTVELNMVAEYLTAHGIDSSPCSSRLSIKDYRRQIEKLQEAQQLREGQLPLMTKILSISQKYTRDSMDMLRTLKKTYSPPAAPTSPSHATAARPQNPVQEQQEPTLIIDSRHNEDVSSHYLKPRDPIRPTRSVLSQINIRIPINIISVYKALELDLPIEDLESGDPQKVRYISSKHRATNWKIVGKTLDVKIYSDSNAHSKPKTLSLFVVGALLDPPIILGQPFLKQSKRYSRNE
ncbi:unnamed protein product [Clonostachys solani]|uniref:Uncharacterized protein n=1 Tax=Clonostachys solani TaxID=160281 RepID=A0A9N9ZFK5_9HYPO|nr:unnamed protein product [Clonostachys solani]